MAKKKTADLEQTDEQDLRERLGYLTEEAAILFVKIEELNKKATTFYDEKREIEEELERRHMATLKGDDWSFLLEETGSSSTFRYKAAHAALNGLLPYEKHGITVFSASGYYPTTQQRALQISLMKGDPELTKQAVEHLSTLLKFVKPVDDNNTDDDLPYKRISVFESTCSEFGSYWLAIDVDRDMYELYRTKYHSCSCVHKAKTLHDLLTYVEKHHPYRSRNEDGDEDDD